MTTEKEMLEFLEMTPDEARVIRSRHRANRESVREIEKKLNE